MRKILRRLLMVLVTVALTSCGGGDSEVSSGGSSGFGGTGISLVRGNIASVNGQTISVVTDNEGTLQVVAKLLINPALAQAIDSAALRVAGGGRNSAVDSNGRFELVNVEPTDNLVLRFSVNGVQVATLSVGSVDTGVVVNVTNVRLDTASGSAQSDQINKESNDVPDDDNSEDDVSEDDNSEDDNDGDSEDEDSDDESEDGVSEDDESEDDNE